jgi:hypothetical protein
MRPDYSQVPLLQLLGTPRIDELILWEKGLTRPQLIAEVRQLVAAGQITPEILQRTKSFQLKKAVKAAAAKKAKAEAKATTAKQ